MIARDEELAYPFTSDLGLVLVSIDLELVSADLELFPSDLTIPYKAPGLDPGQMGRTPVLDEV